MKRLATVVLIVAWAACSACAQRGASHGGFSGHSAASFHGGFSGSGPAFHGGSAGSGPAFRGSFTASAPTRFAGPPRYTFNGPPRSAFTGVGRYPATAQGFARSGPGNFNVRSAYPDRSSHRMPYRPPYRGGNRFGSGGPYVYTAWPGWYNPYLLGYPYLADYSDYGDNNDSSASQGYLSQDYGSEPAEQGQTEPPPLPAWRSSNPPQLAAASESAEPVTIVFSDGRPPEQIHNYLLTPTTLYILDQHRQQIPIDHLDLAATEKVNRDVGIDFSLPGPSR
jgi:hypothetical protein